MQVPESIQDKIFGYIDAIAEKLGVAAEYVFKVLVKQQIIHGITSIVVWLMSLIAVVVMMRFASHFDKKAREEEFMGTSDNWALVLWATSGFLGFILCLVTVLGGPDAIGKIINPEYYALKEIIEAVK